LWAPFYRAWINGHDPALALSLARRELLARGTDEAISALAQPFYVLRGLR